MNATLPIDPLFERLERELLQHPVLGAEFEASRAEFLGAPPMGDLDAGARRRHLEWYLLERTDARGPEIALERVVRDCLADDEPAAAALDSLRTSHVGFLEVTDVRPDAGAWLRDLGGRGEFPVVDARAAAVLAPGDLVAGRLYPVTDGGYLISRAAAIHRNAELLAALQADFERERAHQRGVLRVSQLQIERMIWLRAAEPTQDPVGGLRALLHSAGISDERVSLWIQELEAAPFDEDRLVHGAQDVMASILDRLAFETDLDLEAARRALLHAWAHLSGRGPGSGPSLQPKARPDGESPARDVAGALARFEERRRQGVPIASILDELERDLALDGAGDEDGDDGRSPDFPGVVGAMVEEFLWETGARENEAAARRHHSLRGLGRSAQSVGVFEDLAVRDLLAYAAWWLPELGQLTGADDARQRIASLGAFCRWAEEAHGLTGVAGFGPALHGLATSLPRIAEANRRKTRSADATEGSLYQVQSVGDADAEVSDQHGRVHTARLDADLARWLRPGDRLRATRHDDGEIAVYCCFPPEAAQLIEP